MEPTEITLDKYIKFMVDFYSGKYPHLRLGQAFCNEFNLIGESSSDLFYCEDNNKATIIIFDRYIWKGE